MKTLKGIFRLHDFKQLTFFVGEIRRDLDDGLLTDAVFINLKKVIDYRVLLNKLQRYGVCDRTLLWFSSYLQGCFQRVEVDNVLSSTLGPFAFMLQLFRERLSEKNVQATIPKGNMLEYDQYTVPDNVAVELSFVAFL